MINHGTSLDAVTISKVKLLANRRMAVVCGYLQTPYGRDKEETAAAHLTGACIHVD